MPAFCARKKARATLLVLVPLLAGCIGPEKVDVTKLEREQPSYMLVARRVWLIDKDTIKQAFMQTAQQICGQSGIANLQVDEPDYIRSDILPPRGYVHCR